MVTVVKAEYSVASNELSTAEFEFKWEVNIIHICFYTALIKAFDEKRMCYHYYYSRRAGTAI